MDWVVDLLYSSFWAKIWEAHFGPYELNLEAQGQGFGSRQLRAGVRVSLRVFFPRSPSLLSPYKYKQFHNSTWISSVLVYFWLCLFFYSFIVLISLSCVMFLYLDFLQKLAVKKLFLVPEAISFIVYVGYLIPLRSSELLKFCFFFCYTYIFPRNFNFCFWEERFAM